MATKLDPANAFVTQLLKEVEKTIGVLANYESE